MIDEVRKLTQDFIQFLEPELSYLLHKNIEQEQSEIIMVEDNTVDLYAFCEINADEVANVNTRDKER